MPRRNLVNQRLYGSAKVLLEAFGGVRFGVCGKGLIFMAERHAVRSCLSECLRYRNVRESGHFASAAERESGADGHKIVPPSQAIGSAQDNWSSAYGCPSCDVGYEIKQILSRDCATDHSAVFGCSPPIRSCNPLSRDGQFRRCALMKQPDGFYMSDVLPSVKNEIGIYSSAVPQV